MDELELSVVICNHNSGRFLPAALAALQKNTTCRNAEIIVVDGGSSDGCVDDLPTERPGELPVRLIRRPTNIGFCVANNLGVDAARGRFVCFAQSDGEMEPDWDTPLLEALADPGVVAAGGLVMKMNPPGTIDSAGIAIAPNFASWSLCEYQTPEHAGLVPGQNRDVVGVSPAMLMTRKVDHIRAGGFWETLWVYGDEPDYNLRLGRLGRIVVCPASAELHWIGGTTGAHQSPLRLHQSSRNRLLNIARHMPTWRLPSAIFLAAAFDILQLLQQRNRISTHAVLRGWRAGISGMPAARRLSTPVERAAIVKKVSTLRESIAQQRSLGRTSIRRV